MSAAKARSKVMRPLDWTFPPAPVERELVRHEPQEETGRPPLLFVHGMSHGAWSFEEHWIPAAVERGWACAAVSLRGHGSSGGHSELRRWKYRDYEHDVMQAIIELPAAPVIIGHSMGAQVVRRVLERYVAPAAVLVAPPGAGHGVPIMLRFARRRPAAFLRAAAAQPIVLNEDDLFGPEMDPAAARSYAARMTPEAPLAQFETMLRPQPTGSRSPVLVLGGSEDSLVPVSAVIRTAAIYGTKAHVFRGMGHDLMLEPRWRQPLDLMLDWLERTVTATRTDSLVGEQGDSTAD